MSPSVSAEALVRQEEQRFVLEVFDDFKDLVRRLGDAEMRITLALDKTTNEPEIIFAGFNFKRSIEGVRKVYRLRREERAGARQ